jgi:hypothetical protein
MQVGHEHDELIVHRGWHMGEHCQWRRRLPGHPGWTILHIDLIR